MVDIGEFQFLNPGWLLLLPLIWLLLGVCARRWPLESAWQKLCEARLLAHMTAGQGSSSTGQLAIWLIGLLLTLGVVAIATPSWSRVSQPVLEATTARIILLDMSQSMLVQDLRPNRFAHAVAAATELIAGDFDGETGLIVFSDSAFVVAPLSRDQETLQAFVEAMHPETMPVDGFNLAQAIETAGELLKASFSGSGDILVLSAGDGNDELAVSVAAKMAEQDHRVSILAIGSPSGGPVVDANGGLIRDPGDQIQLSRTNFSLLQRIADAGNGIMAIAVSDLTNDDPLVSRIGAAQLAQSTRSHDSVDGEAADNGAWLIWFMLPIAVVLFRRNLVYLVPLMLLPLLQNEAYASESGGFWKHSERLAYEAYQAAEYDRAAALTSQSMLRGNSLYRQGNYLQALQAYDDNQSAESLYNRGNSLAMLSRYLEATRAYQQALALQPDFADARYNLRLLEIVMRRQAQSNGDAQGGETDPTAQPEGESDATETRIGYANELEGNPADEQSQGPGSGASQRDGQVDPLARFDGENPAEQRFVLRARGAEQLPKDEFIEGWINSLPETSTELYRRKFLRDYRERRRQPQ